VIHEPTFESVPKGIISTDTTRSVMGVERDLFKFTRGTSKLEFLVCIVEDYSNYKDGLKQ
jgi:hypothetical protein